MTHNIQIDEQKVLQKTQKHLSYKQGFERYKTKFKLITM